ncbi:peptidoglycan recognition protein family protein [Streptomyces sp. NPDC088925]|uniref:peptidoglycan recognition protein family protein n=1 Tax=Streptomyces sp. NPDC088925 TaxID=3365914 RepID=UPI00381D3616
MITKPRSALVAAAAVLVVAAVVLGLALSGAFDSGGGGGHRETGSERAASTPPPAAAALRPRFVSRAKWGADPRLLDQKPHYADSVHAIVIHHTDTPNGYSCADSASYVRDIYQAHATARGWGDIGYNFLVDRCGTIFEGRLGGVDRPVIGAHTVGLNKGTTGIAAIGTYTAGVPVPAPMRRSIERIIAWKLGLTEISPSARTQLVSTNSKSRFPKDTSVNLPTVLGHIEAYETDCPGQALMDLLPEFRRAALKLQGKAKLLAAQGASRNPETADRGQGGVPGPPMEPRREPGATNHRSGARRRKIPPR